MHGVYATTAAGVSTAPCAPPSSKPSASRSSSATCRTPSVLRTAWSSASRRTVSAGPTGISGRATGRWVGDRAAVSALGHRPRVLRRDRGGRPRSHAWKKGDRVLVPFSQGEGTCEWCRTAIRTSATRHSFPGVAYWGGFGRYVGIPHADVNLVALPESVAFIDAASMGCRYMTSFHAVVDQAHVQAGEWVAVHGCGGVGLSAVQIATAIGRQRHRRRRRRREARRSRRSEGAVATRERGEGRARRRDHRPHRRRRARLDRRPRRRRHVPQLRSCALRKRGRHICRSVSRLERREGRDRAADRLIVLKELQVHRLARHAGAALRPMLRMVESGKLKPGQARAPHASGSRR